VLHKRTLLRARGLYRHTTQKTGNLILIYTICGYIQGKERDIYRLLRLEQLEQGQLAQGGGRRRSRTAVAIASTVHVNISNLLYL
jgi:hypothetical protein